MVRSGVVLPRAEVERPARLLLLSPWGWGGALTAGAIAAGKGLADGAGAEGGEGVGYH